MPLSIPTPWLKYAWADLGVAAVPGPGTSARVHAYYADAGHAEVTGDDVAWCAAFTGACLERAGIRCTRSLLARSYLSFGEPIDSAQAGAVAIFSRGTDPALGHVGFVVGETPDSIIILGGNQSNAVGVIAMPRARLLGLRWPADPAAPESDSASDPFQRALAHVLTMEGGYSDDPYDPGGPTNLGITIADLASYRGIALTDDTVGQLKTAVTALTKADVEPIYRERYWRPCHAPALPASVALFHFDTAVNHGLNAAARMLQQALTVDADGEIGPLTLGAASTANPTEVLDRYADIRRARYRSLPTFWRFGRGWLARVDATQEAARSLLVPQISIIANPKESPMTTTPVSPSNPQQNEPKWWGQSLTIWGTIVTTLATVLPVVGPLIGISISSDMVHQLGEGVVQAAQALGGVIGILMTIYGRFRTTQPLIRRDFSVKL